MVVGCSDDFKIPPPVEPYLKVPEGFPVPEFPEDNAYTTARWELGKQLFYDPIMSRDSSVSCNSCHQLERSFTDGLATSIGIDGKVGTRNAPSLANVAYHPYFTREGGVPTLEMQVLVPIQEHNEFDFNILKIGERLRRLDSYKKLSHEAYGREPDFFVIPRALATFERSLLSGNSQYDQYEFQGNPKALNEQEIRGLKLFFGAETNCSSCHSGFNFHRLLFSKQRLVQRVQRCGAVEIDKERRRPGIIQGTITQKY